MIKNIFEATIVLAWAISVTCVIGVFALQLLAAPGSLLSQGHIGDHGSINLNNLIFIPVATSILFFACMHILPEPTKVTRIIKNLGLDYLQRKTHSSSKASLILVISIMAAWLVHLLLAIALTLPYFHPTSYYCDDKLVPTLSLSLPQVMFEIIAIVLGLLLILGLIKIKSLAYKITVLITFAILLVPHGVFLLVDALANSCLAI